MEYKSQFNEIVRGAVDIISNEDLKAKLAESRPLNIKFGVDPTSPDIHLGHTVPLQKLKKFQDFGHNIQLVIGDYTARIGDPSGRSETRPILTKEQIDNNLKTYADQVFKILDRDRINLFYNSNWLGKLNLEELAELTSKYTIKQLLHRKDFSDRIKNGKSLSIAELLYPLLVGYDSVILKTDIEIGGTDQLFNFVVSRKIQKAYSQKPEVIITLPVLEGVDGVKKMSKSLGNAIGINEPSEEMYKKVMSIPNGLMLKYYELLSNVSVDELNEIRNELVKDSSKNIYYKEQLAREIVSRYHGEDAAKKT